MQRAAARDALQAPGPHARIAPILARVRGEAPVDDLTVVARTAVALGALAAAHPQPIASIDLNPLIVGNTGQGGWATGLRTPCDGVYAINFK